MTARPASNRGRPGGCSRRVRAAGAVAALAICAGLGSARAEGLPWLPPAGSTTVGVAHGTASASRFHLHDSAVDLPFGTMERTATTLNLAVSVADSVALDLEIGQTEASARTLGANRGRSDMRFGAAWRILDEEAGNAAWKPTVTVRAGRISAGDYAADTLHAPGTGRSGFEASVAVGKIFADTLSIGFEVGARRLADPVPARSLLTVKARFFSPPPLLGKILPDPNGMSLGVAFHRRQSSGGRSMTSLAFPPPLLPEVQRDVDQFVAGSVLTFRGIEVAVDAFRVLEARNAPGYNGVVLAVSYNFDLGRVIGML